MKHPEQPGTAADDESTLRRLGYAQELARRMSGFSNLAISMSIICILSGGVTSFHQGLCGAGGASYGIGWPLVCLFSFVVAITMGHLASAFPTAGGLYHWAAILGGRGWGWTTAWFNLAGLVTVIASINLGTILFAEDVLGIAPASRVYLQLPAMIVMTASQAVVNHRGIRITTKLTDFSGYWILAVSAALAALMLAYAPGWHFDRLVTFANYSGPAGGDVWPRTESLFVVFSLGLLLPAYTMTGFDASAHTAEETVAAAENVPKGIWRSVALSGIAGWILLCAIAVSIRDMDAAAAKGGSAFFFIMSDLLPVKLAYPLYFGIIVAMYLCGLATITSASRMTYAFARDGGLPFSSRLREVSPRFRTPAVAIWVVSATAILFTLYTPVYDTVAACAAIFLYLSYVLPTAIGVLTYGRSWKKEGPWSLGPWFRPLGVVAVFGCLSLVAIGIQPPNEKSIVIIGAMIALLVVAWYGFARKRFPGPPHALLK